MRVGKAGLYAGENHAKIRQEGGTAIVHNWQKMATDYIAGSDSYAEIAEKYGVSRRQVEEHGRKEGWGEKRREFRGKVAERTAQKRIDKKASRAAARLSGIEEAAGLLVDQLLAALQADEKQLMRRDVKGKIRATAMINGGNAVAIARTLEVLAGVIRDVSDRPGAMDRTRIRDMEERLALEKDKARGGDEEGGGVILLPEVQEEEHADGMETAAEADGVHGAAGV